MDVCRSVEVTGASCQHRFRFGRLHRKSRQLDQHIEIPPPVGCGFHHTVRTKHCQPTLVANSTYDDRIDSVVKNIDVDLGSDVVNKRADGRFVIVKLSPWFQVPQCYPFLQMLSVLAGLPAHPGLNQSDCGDNLGIEFTYDLAP